ncbi:unnamed protein product, partial [Prorocentrum cordatum]
MAATPIRSRRRCTGPPWSRAPHRRGERLLPTPPATACGPCTAPRRFWAKPAPAHRSCCPGRAAAGRLRVRLRNAQGQTHALPHLRSHAPEPQRDLAAGPPRVVLRDLAAAERRPPVSPQSSCLTWSWASPRAKRPPPTGRPAPSQATLSPQSCRHLGGRTRAGSRGACTRPRRTPCPRQSGRAHGRWAPQHEQLLQLPHQPPHRRLRALHALLRRRPALSALGLGGAGGRGERRLQRAAR